jgi:hypothetical protein
LAGRNLTPPSGVGDPAMSIWTITTTVVLMTALAFAVCTVA